MHSLHRLVARYLAAANTRQLQPILRPFLRDPRETDVAEALVDAIQEHLQDYAAKATELKPYKQQGTTTLSNGFTEDQGDESVYWQYEIEHADTAWLHYTFKLDLEALWQSLAALPDIRHQVTTWPPYRTPGVPEALEALVENGLRDWEPQRATWKQTDVLDWMGRHGGLRVESETTVTDAEGNESHDVESADPDIHWDLDPNYAQAKVLTKKTGARWVVSYVVPVPIRIFVVKGPGDPGYQST